ncbi:testis-expressed protein 29 isoform X2 [Peromyscus maniculatus bairdii]|uniref:testis-expressed protein 29 isoform X2 n=1 Tax=Peromyscus maniculatus bairdii TaxID=230844 RepID=UPI001C2F0C9C|nr:testis-expressed protein 29 isoform X1 [Peromyscus maniculatus bairdii]
MMDRCSCPVPLVLRCPVFQVWTLWVPCADVSRLPGVDALGPSVLGYPIFQVWTLWGPLLWGILSSRCGRSGALCSGVSRLPGVDALGPSVLGYPVFQAWLIPATLSSDSVRYSPEIKTSPPHILKKFAVCDIPLYEICDYNITRDQCKDLGCCFYRGVCYKKAVPIYVHVFSVLIMLIAGFFVVAIVFRVIQEVKRETEISVEAESSAKISEAPEQTTTQDPSSLKPTSTDSTKRTTSQVDATVTLSEAEETEE